MATQLPWFLWLRWHLLQVPLPSLGNLVTEKLHSTDQRIFKNFAFFFIIFEAVKCGDHREPCTGMQPGGDVARHDTDVDSKKLLQSKLDSYNWFTAELPIT